MTQPFSINNNSQADNQADNDGSSSHSQSFGEERTQPDATSMSGETSNSRAYPSMLQAIEGRQRVRNNIERRDRSDPGWEAIAPKVDAFRANRPDGPFSVGEIGDILGDYIVSRARSDGIDPSGLLADASLNPTLPESHYATENPEDPAHHSRRESSQRDQSQQPQGTSTHSDKVEGADMGQGNELEQANDFEEDKTALANPPRNVQEMNVANQSSEFGTNAGPNEVVQAGRQESPATKQHTHFKRVRKLFNNLRKKGGDE